MNTQPKRPNRAQTFVSYTKRPHHKQRIAQSRIAKIANQGASNCPVTPDIVHPSHHQAIHVHPFKNLSISGTPMKRGSNGHQEVLLGDLLAPSSEHYALPTHDPHHDDHSHPALYPAPGPVAFVLGNPGPLGLLCFGMTTDMLMFMTAGWAEPALLPTVFSYAAFYGGFGQFVAGVLELIKGNTFAGTAFSSYGCFWMGWYLLHYLMASDPKTFLAAKTGEVLWCMLWAVLTAGFFVVTLRKNLCLQVVFSTLTVTFVLFAAGQYSPSALKAAGYIGFFCGSSSIYAAFAQLYQDEMGWTMPGLAPTHYL